MNSNPEPASDEEDPPLDEWLSALFEASPLLDATPYPARKKVAAALAQVAMRSLRAYQELVGEIRV